jgi:phage baseplate assembly protein W
MAVDIYFKTTDYQFFKQNEIEVEDELEQFLQNVDMVISTPKGSVLGDPNFGCSLEQFLWDTTKGGYDIKQEISSQIYDYVVYENNVGINYDIEVSFIKGEIYDTAIVDLIIDRTKVVGYVINP